MKILQEPALQSIPATNLQEGQIAVITEWTAQAYIGLIVIRFRDHLVQVGGRELDRFWSNFFEHQHTANVCKVRILQKGTLLEV